MSIGLIYHQDYLKHETGFHPERKERVERSFEYLKNCKLKDAIQFITPQQADTEVIELNHPVEYIKMIEQACRSRSYLDMDTVICPDSYKVALLAVGGVIEGVRKVFSSDIKRAFALIRPPGHHAEPDTAMGFCIFNNIAIGAKFAKKEYGVNRILIVDFDVHHGNGTQTTFYEDEEVFYFSIHRYPFYPGTGLAHQIGEGKGKGFTLNIPLESGCGDSEYIKIFKEVLQPRMDDFQPEVIFISAGFDAYEKDPLGGMNLTIGGFYKITEVLVEISEKFSEGRIISALEGGYNITDLPRLIEAHLSSLCGASYE
jgi:acetoin utilization deacetylase AcuC-like enzyme